MEQNTDLYITILIQALSVLLSQDLHPTCFIRITLQQPVVIPSEFFSAWSLRIWIISFKCEVLCTETNFDHDFLKYMDNQCLFITHCKPYYECFKINMLDFVLVTEETCWLIFLFWSFHMLLLPFLLHRGYIISHQI